MAREEILRLLVMRVPFIGDGKAALLPLPFRAMSLEALWLLLEGSCFGSRCDLTTKGLDIGQYVSNI